MTRTNRTRIVVGLLMSLAVAAAARPARACGGFFCSTVPVDQSGEQIVFSVTPGHVTAYIQISYSGSAQDFAWVVPVLAKPDISLGSLTTFQAVGARTQPTFRLDVQTDGGGYCGYALPEAATGAGRNVDAGAPGVTVVDAQDVGPLQHGHALVAQQSGAVEVARRQRVPAAVARPCRSSIITCSSTCCSWRCA